MSIICELQLRMARAALGLSFDELAKKTGVSARTIRRIERENGLTHATVANLKLIKQTLEAHGIEFIGTEEEGPGIRLWHNKS